MVASDSGRYLDVGLLVARLGFGLGFTWYHGLPKMTGGLEGLAGTGSAMRNFGIDGAHLWFGMAAGLAEAVGGLLFALGLFFRPASAALMVVMFVATLNHYVTGQGTPSHAFKNFWILLGFGLIGPGRYSLDHLLTERRRRARGDAAPAPRARVGEVV